MTLNGILVLLGLVAFFAIAIVWISKQGGWQSGGCNGNCSSCMNGCSTHPKKDDTQQ